MSKKPFQVSNATVKVVGVFTNDEPSGAGWIQIKLSWPNEVSKQDRRSDRHHLCQRVRRQLALESVFVADDKAVDVIVCADVALAAIADGVRNIVRGL